MIGIISFLAFTILVAVISYVASKNTDESTSTGYFPKIEKLEHKDANSPYDDLVSWFYDGSGFEIPNDMDTSEYEQNLNMVTPLNQLIKEYHPESKQQDQFFLKEFLLWGLVEFKKLSKLELEQGYQFKDAYGGYFDSL